MARRRARKMRLLVSIEKEESAAVRIQALWRRGEGRAEAGKRRSAALVLGGAAKTWLSKR